MSLVFDAHSRALLLAGNGEDVAHALLALRRLQDQHGQPALVLRTRRSHFLQGGLFQVSILLFFIHIFTWHLSNLVFIL